MVHAEARADSRVGIDNTRVQLGPMELAVGSSPPPFTKAKLRLIVASHGNTPVEIEAW